MECCDFILSEKWQFSDNQSTDLTKNRLTIKVSLCHQLLTVHTGFSFKEGRALDSANWLLVSVQNFCGDCPQGFT